MRLNNWNISDFTFFWIFFELINVIIKIICLLIAVAYYTIAERKIMGSVQRRYGPNVVGIWGLLQPLADGLKLIVKKMLVPIKANSRIFVFAPILSLALSLISWSIRCLQRRTRAKELGPSVWLGFPLMSVGIAQQTVHFFQLWPFKQWVNSLLGLLFCYALLFFLVNWIRGRFGLKPVAWKYFVWLMVVDVLLNFAFGIYYMGYRETAIGQLFVKCPIAVSPGFLVIEVFLFWFWSFIKKR